MVVIVDVAAAMKYTASWYVHFPLLPFVCANDVIDDISMFYFSNEWNCFYVFCMTIRCYYCRCCCYIFHYWRLCVRFFIIYWQSWLEMMALDLCHVVFDDIVFIAPLYWGVNDVL